MFDEEDPTKYCCLLTSTPQQSSHIPLKQPQVHYDITASKSVSTPLFTHSSVGVGQYNHAILSYRKKQSRSLDSITRSENESTADCSKSPWLGYSSSIVHGNSAGTRIIPQKRIPARPLQEITGNQSPLANFPHILPNPMISPILQLNPRPHHGVKTLIQVDSVLGNECANSPSAENASPNKRIQQVTRRKETGHLVHKHDDLMVRHHRTVLANNKYLHLGKDVGIAQIPDLKYTSDTPASPNVASSFDVAKYSRNETNNYSSCSQLSSPFERSLPRQPVHNRFVYLGGSCAPVRFGDQGALYENGQLSSDKPAASEDALQGLRFQGQSNTRSVGDRTLLTASMCMPKSGTVRFPSQSFLHSSPFIKKIALKPVFAPEPECKVPLPAKIAAVTIYKTKPKVDGTSHNAQKSHEESSTPAKRKCHKVASNESADSGFDSIDRPTDNYSNDYSSLDDYSPDNTLSYQLHRPNLTHVEVIHPLSKSTTDDALDSNNACLLRVHRKLDIPHRSASPLDPQFRGVTLQMRTKMEEDDQVQLSIKAFFNCRSSTRLLNKTNENDAKPTEHNDSSSSDSDFAAELFPKKRHAHNSGKQCASCTTKTTPLWRDAEDGTPLCNACGIRYRKYKVRCVSCWHIPRKETKMNQQCTNCGAMLKLSVVRTKPCK